MFSRQYKAFHEPYRMGETHGIVTFVSLKLRAIEITENYDFGDKTEHISVIIHLKQ